MVRVRMVYLGFLGEAEPGESHELFLALGEGVLGVGVRSHAGGTVSCEATKSEKRRMELTCLPLYGCGVECGLKWHRMWCGCVRANVDVCVWDCSRVRKVRKQYQVLQLSSHACTDRQPRDSEVAQMCG